MQRQHLLSHIIKNLHSLLPAAQLAIHVNQCIVCHHIWLTPLILHHLKGRMFSCCVLLINMLHANTATSHECSKNVRKFYIGLMVAATYKLRQTACTCCRHIAKRQSNQRLVALDYSCTVCNLTQHICMFELCLRLQKAIVAVVAGMCAPCTIQAVLQYCDSMHLKSREDIQSQCEVPRSDAGVDQSSVGVYVWRDTTPSHVCHQSQGLAQLLSLPTQADHCTSLSPTLRIDFAAGGQNSVGEREPWCHKQMVHTD